MVNFEEHLRLLVALFTILGVLIGGGIGLALGDGMVYRLQITDSSVHTQNVSGTVVQYNSLSDDGQRIFIQQVSNSESRLDGTTLGTPPIQEFKNISYIEHNGNLYQVFYSENPRQIEGIAFLTLFNALVGGAIMFMLSATGLMIVYDD